MVGAWPATLSPGAAEGRRTMARDAPTPALGELSAAPSLAPATRDRRRAGGARLRPRLPAALRPGPQGVLRGAVRAHARVGRRDQPRRLRRASPVRQVVAL